MSDSIVDVFEQASGSYDSVGVDFFTPMGAALVEAAAPPPGASVLDVGCGRGAVLFPAAAAVGPTGSVTGIGAPPPRRNDDLFGTAESITAALRGAGFETISVREVTVDSRFRDADQLFDRAGSHAGRQLVQHIPAAARPAAVADVAAAMGAPITFHTRLRIVLAA